MTTAAIAAGAPLAPWRTRAKDVPDPARLATVSILHTTDLHGHILPTRTYDGIENVGGLARCATQIGRWRRENPDSLLLDIGDVYQGTHVSRSNGGRLMIDLFNRLRYDAWVVGNHEFDWGMETLASALRASAMPALASNAKFGGRFVNQIDDRDNAFARIRPYVVKEVAGFRIGIIGSLTPGLPAWLHPELRRDFEAVEPLVSVRYSLRKLQEEEKADAIVLACHFGLKGLNAGKPARDDYANRVNEIAAACPEIDAVIAGHTHRDIPVAEVSGIPYTQAGYFGIYAGRVNLSFDRETRKVVDCQVETVRMDAGIEPDPVVLSMSREALDLSAAELSRTIGEFTAPLPRDGRHGEPPASLLLITRAIRHCLDTHGIAVDGVLHGLFVNDRDLAAGPVTLADTWQIIPYANRIATARIAGADLPRLMETVYGAPFSTHQLDGFRIEATGSGRRTEVVSIRLPDGSPVDPARQYTIALNAFDAQSGGRRFTWLHELVTRPEAELTLHAPASREALIGFIAEKRRISPQDLAPV